MQSLYIPVLLGTAREGRKSIFAARFIADAARTFENVETELIDPKDLHLPGEGRKARDPRYTKVTERADGFFIVTPEYNHSFPGSLKRMLDSELENYFHKPVAFAGVSSGRWGGVRAIEALTGVVKTMGMVTMRTDVQFPNVQELFSEGGELQDDAYRERAETVWRELIWLSTVLKWGRENVDSAVPASSRRQSVR